MEKVINILNVAWEYRFLILLAFTLVLVILRELNVFKGNVLKAMLYAEDLAKDALLGDGMEQEQWVVNHLYLFIPKRWLFIISRLLSETQLKEVIRKIYHNALDYIDDGELNNSF